MEAVQEVLTNPELVETILNLVPVDDLVDCALVNWTWNKEAVKILNRKAIVKLDFDHHKVSSYIQLIREGGRCHDQIGLDCRGKPELTFFIFHGREEVTTEQFQSVLSASEIFGGTRIKHLMMTLKFGDESSSRTLEEYQPIFAAAQNVELLTLEYELKNGFAASSTLACFPDGISFHCLKDLYVRLDCEDDENEKRMLMTKLVGISQNLAQLSGADNIVGMCLEEMGKTPGRLEKIVMIDTCPQNRVAEILMKTEIPNLKILYFEIPSGIIDKVVPILEKYKDNLVELRLSLMYGGGGELILPKSMSKLQKLHIHFMCPFLEDEDSEEYPVLKFPTPAEHDPPEDGDGGEFYPNLKEFQMDGNRQRRVLEKYLDVLFPDPLTNSIFASVEILDLASNGSEWSDIVGVETHEKLMHYFPNAVFQCDGMVLSSSSDEFDSFDSSDEYLPSDDSDD